MKTNEVIDCCVAELERVGIKPTLEETGSGHVRMSWRVKPEMAERFYILPSTPSDWRSRLNSRSDVRGLLREDGVDLTKKKPPPLVNKPAPAAGSITTVPYAVDKQIDCMRGEIADLIEMVFEMAHLIETKLTTQAAVLVEAVQTAVKPEKIDTRTVRAVNIVEFVTRTPMPTETIARKCGLPKSNTYSKWMYAQGQKKVFLKDGMWGLVVVQHEDLFTRQDSIEQPRVALAA